ncbi:GPW/gp25 family protein [Streptomyces sp. NPDC004980]
MTGRLMGLSFPFRIDPEGSVGRAEDLEKIELNLRHLLANRCGERVMLRGYGAGVQHRLQEPNNAPMHALIRHDIEQALRRYLPQVRLTAPITITSAAGQLTVTLTYTIHPGEPVRRLSVAIPQAERP